jgi:hypothetical protein
VAASEISMAEPFGVAITRAEIYVRKTWREDYQKAHKRIELIEKVRTILKPNLEEENSPIPSIPIPSSQFTSFFLKLSCKSDEPYSGDFFHRKLTILVFGGEETFQQQPYYKVQESIHARNHFLAMVQLLSIMKKLPPQKTVKYSEPKTTIRRIQTDHAPMFCKVVVTISIKRDAAKKLTMGGSGISPELVQAYEKCDISAIMQETVPESLKTLAYLNHFYCGPRELKSTTPTEESSKLVNISIGYHSGEGSFKLEDGMNGSVKDYVTYKLEERNAAAANGE